MDGVKVVLICALMQTLLACLYLQTQLIFYIEEQRRRTARRSAVFLLLSLTRRRLHCLPTSPPTVLDPTRANCCLVGKLRERSRPPGRMTRSSLLSLSELLHPSIEGRIYAGSCKQKLF